MLEFACLSLVAVTCLLWFVVVFLLLLLPNRRIEPNSIRFNLSQCDFVIEITAVARRRLDLLPAEATYLSTQPLCLRGPAIEAARQTNQPPLGRLGVDLLCVVPAATIVRTARLGND